MTHIFSKPLLERNVCDEPQSIKEYTLAGPNVKDMMIQSDACGTLLIVDPFGYARMIALPRSKKSQNKIIHIVGNASNDELDVVLLQPTAFNQTVTVLPLTKSPRVSRMETRYQTLSWAADLPTATHTWLDCRIVSSYPQASSGLKV